MRLLTDIRNRHGPESNNVSDSHNRQERPSPWTIPIDTPQYREYHWDQAQPTHEPSEFTTLTLGM